jgi:hypothetical protein
LSKYTIVLDVVSSALALYLSLWLYETANWVSLTVSGTKATLVWTGLFPTGVVALSSGNGGLAGAKLLQVGICVGVALFTFVLLRRKGLPLARVTVAGLTGIYLASVIWEMLSLAASMPPLVEEGMFVGLSALAAMGVIRGLEGTQGRDSTRNPNSSF